MSSYVAGLPIIHIVVLSREKDKIEEITTLISFLIYVENY